MVKMFGDLSIPHCHCLAMDTTIIALQIIDQEDFGRVPHVLSYKTQTQ